MDRNSYYGKGEEKHDIDIAYHYDIIEDTKVTINLQKNLFGI